MQICLWTNQYIMDFYQEDIWLYNCYVLEGMAFAPYAFLHHTTIYAMQAVC